MQENTIKNLQVQEKVIEGNVYRVQPFPGKLGLSLMGDVMETLKPIVSILPIAQELEKLSSSEDREQASKFESILLTTLLENVATVIPLLSKNDLCIKLFSCTKLNGKDLSEQVFNLHFTANYEELFLALIFVIEVNYKKAFFQLLTMSSFLGK